MPRQKQLAPKVWITSATFSDGSKVSFRPTSVVVFVGPNNSGKSATLRALDGKLGNPKEASSVVSTIEHLRVGKPADVEAWCKPILVPGTEAEPNYQWVEAGVHHTHIKAWWGNVLEPLRGVAKLFCRLLRAEDRLRAADPASNFAPATQPPTHALHHLFIDPHLEKKVSDRFRQAFGVGVAVHRVAGTEIPLHIGDAVSMEPIAAYLGHMSSLPRLNLQGDGMRSFAGVLLTVSIARESILLIDEPEAFLHPPQAKVLGTILIEERAPTRQLFVATHSGDLLRGMLEAKGSALTVVRLRRDGKVNRVSMLENARLAELWSDPLLRYSNILDGLFHEMVILCEADGDAQFYAALIDATLTPGQRKPDALYTYCGGKHRLPMVARALRGVDVPVRVPVDFDILRDTNPLRGLVDAVGGDTNLIETLRARISAGISSLKPELSVAEVKESASKAIDSLNDPAHLDGAKEKVLAAFKRSTPWAIAKRVGKASIPAGNAAKDFETLASELRKIGIHIIETGELEGFCRTIGNHGPAWVNEALKRDLRFDKEFAEARAFALRLID